MRLGPGQESSPEGWATITSVAASTSPEPVLWLTTWDSRVYVSTDRARSFEEIRVR